MFKKKDKRIIEIKKTNVKGHPTHIIWCTNDKEDVASGITDLIASLVGYRIFTANDICLMFKDGIEKAEEIQELRRK